MGYYTAYSLDVSGASIEQMDRIVDFLSKRKIIGYALNDNLECYDTVKWYDHNTDMLELSIEIPDLLFCLHGEGEDTEDLWNKYYKNGRMQECYAEIVYPGYDPRKLRSPIRGKQC